MESSGNSYTLKNRLNVNLFSISLNLQLDSDIDFVPVEIEDLTDENCIYLDEQNEDVLTDKVRAIKETTEAVVRESLIEKGIIKVEVEEPVAQPSEERQISKEEAKAKVISSIEEAMKIAENEGRQYTLDDLINLSIPGSEFTVSIEGDEAILSIDGYEFRLSYDFQLYE